MDSRILSFFLPCALAVTSSSSSLHDNAGVLQYVNPKIGTYGLTPNGNGGMVPSVSPPFGMTRWTPQTRENFISQCPYNDIDSYIHGFQATHQPAIWMGESGQVVLTPGVGEVRPLFEERAHGFRKADEISTPYVYEVEIDAEAVESGHDLTESIFSPVPGGAQPVPSDVSEGADGRTRRDLPAKATGSPRRPVQIDRPERETNATIKVSMTATSHVGHLRFDFQPSTLEPYVFIQATRQNWTGSIEVDPGAQEVYGNNPQRQDYALGPSRAPNFSGYFVSRFSEPFTSYGVTGADNVKDGEHSGTGGHLGAYVKFANDSARVEVRTGVSFVSIEQARRNLDIEAPDTTTFEQTVDGLKQQWLEKLGRVTIEGMNETSSEYDQRTIWYTGLFHALQYPSDFSEPLSENGTLRTFYSGYTDSVHQANDSYYQSWSIWDTFRAEHSLLTLFAPERVNSMLRSLLLIYTWTGRLPMWANIIETNIMIGTHVDAVLANALVRNFTSFDLSLAWTAVRKNAFVPPLNDTDLLYYDREPYTPDEVRAGLTAYMEQGYVPNDRWAESGSRTLDYAFDDHAASVVALLAGNDTATSQHLLERSQNYRNLFNPTNTSMQSRNSNGTFAPLTQGWTEGDAWIYTFAVPHDVSGLAALFGGPANLKHKLDAYFAGGHNDQTNEPSHHAPYLYSLLGYPASTQPLIRQIAWENYNATSAGLGGNEDLGQMSAWYVFSALGFYPVNPAGEEYVVGSPFFEEVTIRFPKGAATGGVVGDGEGEEEEGCLVISAPGASGGKAFVKGLRVDGIEVGRPVLTHSQIVNARRVEFEMSAVAEEWGSSGGVVD